MASRSVRECPLVHLRSRTGWVVHMGADAFAKDNMTCVDADRSQRNPYLSSSLSWSSSSSENVADVSSFVSSCESVCKRSASFSTFFRLLSRINLHQSNHHSALQGQSQTSLWLYHHLWSFYGGQGDTARYRDAAVPGGGQKQHQQAVTAYVRKAFLPAKAGGNWMRGTSAVCAGSAASMRPPSASCSLLSVTADQRTHDSTPWLLRARALDKLVPMADAPPVGLYRSTGIAPLLRG